MIRFISSPDVASTVNQGLRHPINVHCGIPDVIGESQCYRIERTCGSECYSYDISLLLSTAQNLVLARSGRYSYESLLFLGLLDEEGYPRILNRRLISVTKMPAAD